MKEKVEVYGKGNLGPNRSVIYRETLDDEPKLIWDETKIHKHYNALAELLARRGELLRVAL